MSRQQNKNGNCRCCVRVGALSLMCLCGRSCLNMYTLIVYTTCTVFVLNVFTICCHEDSIVSLTCWDCWRSSTRSTTTTIRSTARLRTTSRYDVTTALADPRRLAFDPSRSTMFLQIYEYTNVLVCTCIIILTVLLCKLHDIVQGCRVLTAGAAGAMSDGNDT